MDSNMIATEDAERCQDRGIRQTTDWHEVWDDGLHIWAVGVPSSGSGRRMMWSSDGIAWKPLEWAD